MIFFRFWDFEKASNLWKTHIMPVLTSVIDGSLNSESLADWETCINGASNRVDPNRSAVAFTSHTIPSLSFL